MEAVLGIDVGGTKLASALLSSTGDVLHRAWQEHHAGDAAALLEKLDRTYQDSNERARAHRTQVTKVGIALAAWLSPERDDVRVGANLGLTDLDVGLELQRKWGIPVRQENDGNAAALGEFVFGAPTTSSLAAICLGTGVGGGIIVEGRLVTGVNGVAGEIGHMPIDPDIGQCVCGGRGCLELVASGPAVARAANLPTARDVVAAARNGHREASDALHQAGIAVGLAVAAIAAVIDPQRVVLTGSLALSAGPFLLPAVQEGLESVSPLSRVRSNPLVSLSTLGPHLGAYGAAALVLTARPLTLKDLSRG